MELWLINGEGKGGAVRNTEFFWGSRGMDGLDFHEERAGTG